MNYQLLIFKGAGSIISFFVILTLVKNYIFLLLGPWYPIMRKIAYIKAYNKRIKQGITTEYKPKVSVIIPAWNEEVGILKTISSVVTNGYENIEVVVVNDGSTDNSHLLVKKYMRELNASYPRKASPVRYFYKENGGKGKALNFGISHATGDIILTIDADSALMHGSIDRLVKYYLDEKIMAVVGNVKVAKNKTLIGVAQQIEYFLGFYNKRGHAILGAEYIFGGACASFRKSVFDQIGLFDADNKTEDIEMSMRTRFYGMRCMYAEDVVSYTEGASTLDGLISQRVRWKKGRLDTFKKYGNLFFSTDHKHNFFLSFMVLPFSLLTEIQLLFEPIAIATLVTYSVITSEYLSLALAISFIFLVYMVTAIFSGKGAGIDILLKFIFTWPFFYFLDWVELLALWKSIKLLRTKKDVQWQKWQREGIALEI